MILATLETSHHRFAAVGETEDQARELLRRAWIAHRAATAARYTWDEIRADVTYLGLTPGMVLRDGEPFED